MDAFHLGELYYKEDFEPIKKRSIKMLNLRHLTRQFESLTSMYVQAKLNFQQYHTKYFLYIQMFLEILLLRRHFIFYLNTQFQSPF